MALRDIGSKLPPGFRFHPNDEELVCYYLYNKINANDKEALKDIDLVEIDLHVCEPWQLPDVAKLNADEWYFFSFRDRKYATGYRTNRATISGYWKATGKDRTVMDPRTREIVGMRKTLVFYKNRAPNGYKTSWIMHEFRLETPNMPPKEDWVLCRVFHKSKSAEDNTHTHLSNFDNNNNNETILSSPNHHYAPHYSNLLKPSPPSSSSPPSNTIDYQPIKLPCGSSEPLMASLSSPAPLNYHQNDDNSLLTPLYEMDIVDQSIGINSSAECDDYGNFIWDIDLERTGARDDMRFEIDDTMVFQ